MNRRTVLNTLAGAPAVLSSRLAAGIAGCMRVLLAFAWCSAALAATMPSSLLPDGTPFPSWSDQTRYSRTYHASQNHPRASDDNPGTEALPFRTISRAALLLKPGERVLIHAGVYRELVRPRSGGEAPDRMIAYEAAPGDQVILKGSRVLTGAWQRSLDPNDKDNAAGARNIFSKTLWMIALPDEFFENGYLPFRTPNASNQELDLMEWALRWKGRVPYSLPRGMLFQDGRRMSQLATYEDLVRLPGSYWVAPDGKTVHIHAFDSGNPNGKLFEAAVQPHIIQPETAGLGFIRISGLTLEHCANGLPRVGVGALFTMGGHHWIVEGNTVRHVNSVGIEAGYQTFEHGDRRFPRRTDPDLGHNILRRNRIYDCGSAGIRGLGVSFALVEDNEISNCGWQDAQFHWEVAGIKLLINQGTLVRNNHVSHIVGGEGIWLDWDNRNSRVTGNIIHDISTVQAAIFIEASQLPNLVDHNVIWNIDGQGVRVADSDNVTIAHNLFGRVSEELVVAKVATSRSLRGRRLTSTGNRFINNIVVDQGKPIASGDAGNVADYNVYVSTAGDAPPAKDSGPHSTAIRAQAEFSPEQMLLTWKVPETLPETPLVKSCEVDFFGRERAESSNIAGPFLALRNTATIQLR